ncbi:hypothetical protein Hanom_Chr04g00369221 [Helianthus anomalus]
MDEEAEEGEIRSPGLNSPMPEEGDRPPSEPPSKSVFEQSLEGEKLGQVGSREAHGEFEKSGHTGMHEVHGEVYTQQEDNNGSVFPENVEVGSNFCGPHHVGASGSKLVDHLDQVGPTPIIGLGKRNRDNRSPPSSGSMQGPPLKSLYHDPNPDDTSFSFDLNRPSFGTEPCIGVSIGGMCRRLGFLI